jgi:hypothetical protein
MASNKTFRFGPVALTTTTTTNLLNPPTATGGTNAGSSSNYIVLNHIRVGNKTAGAVSFATWVGLSAVNTAGTEGPFVGAASGAALTQGVSVPANSYVDWYGKLRLDAADFLVGGASAGTALTIMGEGEIGVAG